MSEDGIELKTRDEISVMREAGQIVREVLDALVASASPGISTLELDRMAEDLALRRKARPAFKGYRGFPRSLCASLNDEVVHGIPDARRTLRDGDLLKLDFGVEYRGFHADAAVTVPVGLPAEGALELLEATRDSLDLAIARMRPGGAVADVGEAVEGTAEGRGFSVVRDFVGHGIGRALHERPKVPNYRTNGVSPRLRPGLVLAIEPMLNAGRGEVEVLADRWTVVTADRKLSAHFEHSVAVTEAGPLVLTAS